MTDHQPQRTRQEMLEMYLDGQLSPEEIADFEAWLNDDGEATETVQLQNEIDEHLRVAFNTPNLSAEQIEKLVEDSPRVHTRSSIQKIVAGPTRRRLLAVFSIVATVVFVLGYWNSERGRTIEPFFKPRPLVAIYQETVEQGFRPYYFCEDAERFALTFAKRQQTPLVLEELPLGRRMVGLSYPGGLSRDTTAILCYANDRPIIVFVDRAVHDNKLVAVADESQELYVHNRRLGDLVVYEVSPFDDSRIVDFLTLEFVEP